MEETETRLRAVFEVTYPVLARYARHRGLSPADADDLVAQTYEVAWRRFDAVPRDDGAVAWLVAVERNLLRNRRRKLRRERSLMERLGPPQADHMEIPIVTWQDIRRALDQLADEDRELILLVAWDGLEPAQAAIALGLTAGATRTRLHRARARMAQVLCLAPDLHDPSASAESEPETASTGGLTDA